MAHTYIHTYLAIACQRRHYVEHGASDHLQELLVDEFIGEVWLHLAVGAAIVDEPVFVVVLVLVLVPLHFHFLYVSVDDVCSSIH